MMNNSESMKLWRQKNREYDLEYKRQYRLTHKQQLKEARRKYYLQHRQEQIDAAKAWAESHPNEKNATNARRLVYKNNVVMMSEEKRVGVCNLCRGVVGIDCKRTDLHHIEYDDGNPEANTLEICPRCHNLEHQAYLNNAKKQRTRTSCIRGHIINSANVRVDKNGWRHCRLCSNIRNKSYRERKKNDAVCEFEGEE